LSHTTGVIGATRAAWTTATTAAAHHAEHAAPPASGRLAVEFHDLHDPGLEDLPGRVVRAQQLFHAVGHPLTHLGRIEVPARTATLATPATAALTAAGLLRKGQPSDHQGQDTGHNTHFDHSSLHLCSPFHTSKTLPYRIHIGPRPNFSQLDV
jgi:hypothetical protein